MKMAIKYTCLVQCRYPNNVYIRLILPIKDKAYNQEVKIQSHTKAIFKMKLPKHLWNLLRNKAMYLSHCHHLKPHKSLGR